MFRITFDFEPVQKKVYNMKIYEMNTTVMMNSSREDALIEVSSTHLHLNNLARLLLQILPDDRIIIRYYQASFEDGTTEIFPTIEKIPENSPTTGNRIAKNGTIVYKGRQSDVLLKYGHYFKLIPYKEGVFRLVPTVENSALCNTPTEEMKIVYEQ